MTFLEALTTHKPMRRTSWWRGQPGDRWLVLTPDGDWLWHGTGYQTANGPRRGDMLAADWEVLEV